MFERAIATLAFTMLATLASAPAHAGIAQISEATLEGRAGASEGDRPMVLDSDSIASIALLSPRLRTLVLESSLHPDLLEGLSALYARTNQHLGALAAGLSDRHWLLAWRLLDHPELVAAMASEASNPAFFFEQITSHSEPVAEAGRTLLLEAPDLVRGISALQAAAAGRYERLLTPHSPATQRTFERLLRERDALVLVMAEPGSLHSLGLLYRYDRAATNLALDEIAAARIAEHAGALPGWASARALEVAANPILTRESPKSEADRVVSTDHARSSARSRVDAVAGTASRRGLAANVTPMQPIPISFWLGGCASTVVGSTPVLPRWPTGRLATRSTDRIPRPGR